ncbi:MAG: transcription-repair coupling factor [Firmicutes bacterium]|nr:transcription-repair coupling factor [Bacillota bacterium]
MNFLDNYFKYDKDSVICGLTNELNVFYVLSLFKKSQKNIILLTSSLYEANNYYNLLQTHSDDVLLFLMDDFLSSMVKTASPELKLTRLNTLDKIGTGKHIIVTNLMAYLKFLPNINAANQRKILLECGKKINREELITNIHSLGYRKESLTTTTGEYSVRGMIIDIFLINEIHPIRIEIDDDVIDNIRYFDENTQTSINKVDKIVIKPIDESDDGEYSSLYDYADEPIVVSIDRPQINASYHKLLEDITEYSAKENISNKLMFLFEDIKSDYEIQLNNFSTSKTDLVINCSSIENFNQDFELLKKNLEKWQLEKKKILFCLSSDSQIKKIKKEFGNIEVVKKKINHGFILGDLVVISEYDIENVKHQYKYQNNFYGGKKIVDYNELNSGDYVVHISHGIGLYNGIVTLTKDGVRKDYIQLLYLNNDKIYVPVEKINNIYKYSDKDGVAPKLNRLNSSSWLKTRQYVQKKIQDISRELIALYKQRASIKCMPYKSYEEEDVFGASFAYNLTADQQKAVNDIFADLASDHPMDRLLCGDVGFGKTEVALRAMFKAVLNNSQVMYLCPTTILSKQQYNVAKERFSSWPIEIALLNRFTPAKEVKVIIEKLEKGTIDIVIGTHKLLNDKIKYKNLGLMIIDEEQRFGVKHKEKIKEYKADINVLTLSATPIPRTLKMALSGLRDLSIIDTAPRNRYPVQTYVISEDDLIIKDAIYKELSRSGQVFVLYNSVENIEAKTNYLRKLIPNEEIRFAHGQMSKEELEDIMDDFIQKKFNIIVCTTIIESGIDIPNANTLIVFDADRLGLAQLYQLRGRVGRSDKIAYAYLMYNNQKMLNDIAIKRLQAIKEFTELGSGYRIAMRDLSIRGSGDIFGSNQAGFVDTVGVALYTKMIEDEMKRQKGEYVEEEDEDQQSLINIETHIADSYVSDEDIKIEIHQMINEIDSYDKLQTIKAALEDRFGKVTESIENYMYEEWFEKIAKKLGIKRVRQTDRLVEIELPENISREIKGDKLLYESYSISQNFNLAYKHNCIVITLYYKNLPEHFIKYIVRLLNTL